MKEYFKKKLQKSLYGSAYSRSLYTLSGLVIREIQCSFQQFFTWRYPIRSIFRVIGINFSSVLRLFLGRSLKYSFSFTGEDRIIEGIIKPIINKTGCYVDVGCNHPKFLSNTYGLYKKGWKGICIDANKELIDKYRYFRPRDIAVNAVVSNEVKEIDFFEIENNVLSTIDKTNLQDAISQDLAYSKKRVTTITLTSILEEHGIQTDFDLLSIDAEEHDFEVLISLDFSIYQPKLIIVEDEQFDFRHYSSNKFVSLLNEKGYKMIGFVLKNAYFKKENQALKTNEKPDR